jgi:hypothetical protein
MRTGLPAVSLPVYCARNAVPHIVLVFPIPKARSLRLLC